MKVTPFWVDVSLKVTIIRVMDYFISSGVVENRSMLVTLKVTLFWVDISIPKSNSNLSHLDYFFSIPYVQVLNIFCNSSKLLRHLMKVTLHLIQQVNSKCNSVLLCLT